MFSKLVDKSILKEIEVRKINFEIRIFGVVILETLFENFKKYNSKDIVNF